MAPAEAFQLGFAAAVGEIDDFRFLFDQVVVEGAIGAVSGAEEFLIGGIFLAEFLAQGEGGFLYFLL